MTPRRLDSLARRFVAWHIARIAEASRPLARARLLFALLTVSLVGHVLVVYGESVVVEPEKKTVARIRPAERPEAKPEAKKDASLARRVLDVTEDDRKNARKDAPKVGGETENSEGVKNRPPDPAKAVPGVIVNADEVDEKPEPDKAAKTKKELESQPDTSPPNAAVPMAAPDAVKEDGKPVDPTVEIPPTKKLDGGRAAIVDKSLRQLDDWTRYQLEGGPSPKDAIPGVFITNTSAEDWQEIVHHFDLCPVAYPDGAEYFLLIDVARATFTKAAGDSALNELKARYASSGIAFSKRKLWNTAVFSRAAEKACAELRIARTGLNLMILAPRQVMAYLAWKAQSTVKAQGLAPAKVRACHARFTRTTDGWILEVTDVVLEDGRVQRLAK